MASVQTAKSKLALCPSHQPFLHIAIRAPRHLFLRGPQAETVPRNGHRGYSKKKIAEFGSEPTRGIYPRCYSGTNTGKPKGGDGGYGATTEKPKGIFGSRKKR
jgi:hypothetical protein